MKLGYSLLLIALCCPIQCMAAKENRITGDESTRSLSPRHFVTVQKLVVQPQKWNMTDLDPLISAKLTVFHNLKQIIVNKLQAGKQGIVHFIHLINNWILAMKGTEIQIKIPVLGTTSTVPPTTSSTSPPTTRSTSPPTTSTTTAPTPNNTVAEGCKNPNNLVLMLDSSNSVTNKNYEKAKRFAAQLAQVWKENSKNNVALIIFSSKVEITMSFEAARKLSPAQVRHNIMAAPRLIGVTNTHLGIRNATQHHLEEGSGLPKNNLILTDGNPTVSSEAKRAAEEMRKAGIQAVVVGIGTSLDQGKLLEIAGDKENLYMSSNFDDLENLAREVSVRLCKNSA